MVREVRGRQHLGLVDVVDLERLEDLRLGEVADPALRHDGDGDGFLDLRDLLRVAHARDAAVPADVRGHALERHHRAGTGVLGDPGLLRVDDVHDDAALEHLRQPGLDPQRPVLGHDPECSHGRRLRDLWKGATEFHQFAGFHLWKSPGKAHIAVEV